MLPLRSSLPLLSHLLLILPLIFASACSQSPSPTATRPSPVLIPTKTPEPFSFGDREAVSRWCTEYRDLQTTITAQKNRYASFIQEVNTITNEMNAALHLSDPVHGPLTTMVGNAADRADQLLDGVNTEAG